MHGHAGGVGDAAAAGDVVVADAVGVDDLRLHLLERDAQRLGELHRERRARAADVGVALDQVHGAVGEQRDVTLERMPPLNQ